MVNTKNIQKYIILHNIRSAYNVGSIFRTADAIGISKIFLTGYTPTPIDKFGRARADIAKTALGAEEEIKWEYKKHPKTVIQKLKEEGFSIIAIEQSEDAVDYKKVKVNGDVSFIVGNEVRGISSSILKDCDMIAEIPMKGFKESLNVSVATGIAIFRILDK